MTKEELKAHLAMRAGELVMLLPDEFPEPTEKDSTKVLKPLKKSKSTDRQLPTLSTLSNTHMKNGLQGWTLTEGMYDILDAENPAVSAVITALEAIRPDVERPYIVLQAPAFGDSYPNYCQTFADEGGYVCEIRIFSGTDFTHYRGFRPDARGGIGEDDEAEFPNLTQTIQIFVGFIADPNAVPDVDGVEWVDVSGEFGPVTD